MSGVSENLARYDSMTPVHLASESMMVQGRDMSTTTITRLEAMADCGSTLDNSFECLALPSSEYTPTRVAISDDDY